MARIRDIILRNTRASQPAANTVDVGTLYFVTDEEVVERSNGTSWDSYSSAGESVSPIHPFLLMGS